MSRGKLVLIIGPSGVGKSEILRELRTRLPHAHFPRSATTRPRRPGESTALYRFVTDGEFDVLLRDGKLLEWAVVHDGDRYGTLLDEIVPAIEGGRTVIREVDVQGFESIRGHPFFSGENARYVLQSIFILPESTEQLILHIRGRSPMDEGELQRRLASIGREMAYADLCDARVRNVERKLGGTVREVERLL